MNDMARTAIKIDREGLTSIINELEANGPLFNQSMLWQKAAEAYNAKYNTDISHSVVMLRVTKEWNIPIKTKPGLRGRGATAAKAAAGLIKVESEFCFLSNKIDAIAERGRYVGNHFSYRWILECDDYSWAILAQRPDGTTFEKDGFSYSGNMKHVFMDLSNHKEIDYKFAVQQIINKFAEKRPEIKCHFNLNDDPKTIGAMIDATYGTSFFKMDNDIKKTYMIKEAA